MRCTRRHKRHSLEMLGWLESSDDISIDPTVTPMDAAIFASALNHDYYEDLGDDKFYTPEEYRKVSALRGRICTKYALRSREAITNNVPVTIDKEKVTLAEYDDIPMMCNCLAHKS